VVARRLDSDAAHAPIRTLGLTKEYGDLVAVDSLDLEVRAGEIFGLLGQNGAGKTTTILMLLGLTEPTAGEARVVGLDPTRQPLGVKRRVGYLPDAVGFYGGLTGRENLRYTAKLNGLTGDDAEERIDVVLDQVRLSDRADDKVDTYSRGMKQRLGIADALVKEPSVLILDEPTTAIDPIGVVEILDLLRDLVREQGLAVLLSSHLLNQVQNVCDRVGIFAAGRLIGIGTVPQLARRFGEGGPRIELGLAEAPEAAARQKLAAALAGIAGVRAVHEPTEGHDLWFVDLASHEDADAALTETMAAVTAAGLRLRSIRELEPTLDDIYRRAVSQAGLGVTRRAVA
jgi:ABC-2 type transport system ATP-binding protein